jgi:hypothetical protein
VFTTGGNAYESGSATEYGNCYDPSRGRHKSRTRPVVGNHEYGTPGAAGYFGYFGAAAGKAGEGWYSYDLGTWHVVVLNSNCGAVSCAVGSAQERWLRADLAASSAPCTAPSGTTRGSAPAPTATTSPSSPCGTRCSEARNNTVFGVLRLTLRAGSYDFRFIPEAGGTYTDSGSGTCH